MSCRYFSAGCGQASWGNRWHVQSMVVRRSRVGRTLPMVGVRTVPAATARQGNRWKALAAELLRQAEEAARSGDMTFSQRRITEARRVLARLGPSDGSQLRERLERVATTGRATVIARPPKRKPKVNKSAKLCSDCGSRDASGGLAYCDGCATKRGWQLCVSCLRLFKGDRARNGTVTCLKCANPKRVPAGKGGPRSRRSVRTVSAVCRR